MSRRKSRISATPASITLEGLRPQGDEDLPWPWTGAAARDELVPPRAALRAARPQSELMEDNVQLLSLWHSSNALERRI